MSSVWCFWEDVAALLIFSHSWILFQDITWQDEHSAPFSWETKVNKQICLGFGCFFFLNIGLSFYTFPSPFIVFILILDRLMSPLFYASCKSDHAASQTGLVCFDLHQEKHRTYFMNKSSGFECRYTNYLVFCCKLFNQPSMFSKTLVSDTV